MSKMTKFQRTSKFPIRFDRLFTGSLFTIASEPSRGLKFSRDNTVYRRAQDNEGFFAYDALDKSKACLLYPEDMVWPLKKVHTAPSPK